MVVGGVLIFCRGGADIFQRVEYGLVVIRHLLGKRAVHHQHICRGGQWNCRKLTVHSAGLQILTDKAGGVDRGEICIRVYGDAAAGQGYGGVQPADNSGGGGGTRRSKSLNKLRVGAEGFYGYSDLGFHPVAGIVVGYKGEKVIPHRAAVIHIPYGDVGVINGLACSRAAGAGGQTREHKYSR